MAIINQLTLRQNPLDITKLPDIVQNKGDFLNSDEMDSNFITMYNDVQRRLLNTGGTITGNLTISGNLVVNGTTTAVNSTVTTINDPVITLANNTAADDNKDRGVEFKWHDGTAVRTGFFGFDDSTGYFSFRPNATNTSEVFSGTLGDIEATNFRGALIGNATTATTLQTARTISLAGDVTGSVSFNGGANVTITTTIAANSVALGADTTGNYAASVAAGSGIVVTGAPGEGTAYTVAHADTSAQVSVDNANGTVIQDITLDEFGHITAIGSVDLDGRYYTETEADARFVNSAGDTMTGDLLMGINQVDFKTNGSLSAPQILGIRAAGDLDARAFVDEGGLSYTTFESASTNIPSGVTNNANGLLTINTHVGNYNHQLAFTNTGGIWHRSRDNTALTAWDRIFADDYHPNADRWTTARTLTLAGDVTGAVSIDGSTNVTITTTIAANSVALGTDTTGNYAAAVAVSGNGLSITGVAGEGTTFTVNSNATSANTANTIVFRDASGDFSAGTITAVDFNSTSDERFKENVTTASGIEVIAKLRGVEFDWKDGRGHSSGVIAQETETVIPHVVKTTAEGKSVNYSAIIAYLIEGMKEQQAQIAELKAKLEQISK